MKPGGFQLFDITIAPVPDVDTMTFTATQVYSDGSVVTWDQEPAADGTEAEFPKPELVLAAETAASPSPSASPSETGSPSATPTITVTASPIAAPSDSSGSSNAVPLVISIVAALLGGGALAVALRRRTT